MGKNKKILIIGGVAAGPKAAARVRRLLPHAEITVIEKGSLISYGSCGLPLLLEGMVREVRELTTTASGIPRNEDYFKNEKNVNFLVKTVAEKINPEKQEVTVYDLDTETRRELQYDNLIIATGGKPLIPPISGVDLPGVMLLHHPDDGVIIKDKIKDGITKIAVIGAGLIGMELAAAIGHPKREVTIIERENQLLPGLLDCEMAALVEDELVQNRVKVLTGQELKKIEELDNGVKKLTLSDSILEAELVVLGVGVRPNADLAKEAGLEIGATGAIKVDEFMRTSDPKIYAAGDCVENRHIISGEQVYVPLASTANKQGRVIGSNIGGIQETFPGVMGTGVFQLFELNGGKTGLTEVEARKLGYEVRVGYSAGLDSAHYHPLHAGGIIKLIACGKTQKLLGAQVVGHGEVIKRLDVLATGMQLGATLDQLATLDLGYAPPFATPIDLSIHAVNNLRNNFQNVLTGINPMEFEQILEENESLVVLDVRTPEEEADRPLAGANVIKIPLYELRANLDKVPKDKEIVTLCELGIRGYEATRILKGAGFEKVNNLQGGVFGLPRKLIS